MKNKRKLLFLTTFMVLNLTIPAMASSVTEVKTTMPTFEYNQSTPELEMDTAKKSENINEKLIERKEMLEETIYSSNYEELSSGEKIVLVKQYFSVRADIFKENQKQVLSASEIVEIEQLRSFLLSESEKVSMDNKIIFSLIEELKAKDIEKLSPKDLELSKSLMKKLVDSYKDLRSAGRNLNILIDTQTKVFNSKQLTLLNKFSQRFEINGEKKDAIELNKKILKLTEGDIEAYKKVSNLLKSEGKSFFFINNKAIELTVPILENNEIKYMAIDDINRMKDFEVSEEGLKLTIKKGENILEVKKPEQKVSFNGVPMSKKFVIYESGKAYFPIHSFFELFRFNVQWNEEIENFIMHQQVYQKNEIDSLPSEETMNMILA